jgi:hypothetical protein
MHQRTDSASEPPDDVPGTTPDDLVPPRQGFGCGDTSLAIDTASRTGRPLGVDERATVLGTRSIGAESEQAAIRWPCRWSALTTLSGGWNYARRPSVHGRSDWSP